VDVLLTAPYYPPHIGGVEIHVRNLASFLSKKHSVRVVSSTGNCIRLRCINIPYSPIPLHFPEFKADVFHSHVPSPFFARGVWKRGLKPHVITYHNDVVVPDVVDGVRIPARIRKMIESINTKAIKPVLESCEVIITTTKSYAETSPVISEFIHKVEVVPNAVDVGFFAPSKRVYEREPIVLYVGRLVEYKGLECLLRAMKIVQKIEKRAKLVVIGDGEDRTRFETISERLELNVEFKGKLSDEAVAEWMRRGKTLVLPSKSRLEAFGIVLLEAMASGTPVIASDIPGVRDVALEGGVVFSDVDDLAEKIVSMLHDSKLAEKLSKKGMRAVREKYRWDVVTDKVEEIYFNLI
jgi:glycosyltransferase involved in cell wall biosynthesis